jgi:hypothetical protein
MVEFNTSSLLMLAGGYYDQVTAFLGTSVINLIVYTIGMVVYTIFIWHLYRFVAHRDIFEIDLKGSRASNALGNFFGYLIVFPILVFIWFGAFALFMFFLAKDLPVQTILLVSMSLVATIRITSYYKQDLSKDVGKLIPLALLAIFLISPDFFSLELVRERLAEVGAFGFDVLRFAAFVVATEWILRIGHSIKRAFHNPSEKPESQ